MIWDKLVEIQKNIESELDATGKEIQEDGMDQFNRPGWVNRIWTSNDYRRAHVDVVDARETKKLWMMHVCIFPHLKSDGPVFGFDVIAGQKKITGAFFDFSPTTDKSHRMVNWFGNTMSKYGYNKTRELPDWAKNIFSPGMIAAGNVREEKELEQICTMGLSNLNAYIDKIGDYDNDSTKEDVIKAQNYYCINQQKNPHTPKTMQSLGLPEEDIKLFCADNLFPTIK